MKRYDFKEGCAPYIPEHPQGRFVLFGEVESDLRQLAEVVLNHHSYSCHWCTIDQGKCEKYKAVLGEESCCQCPKCQIARRYTESEAGK